MHVAVLGGGYAGVTLTRLLEADLPSDVDLTLVNDGPDHLVQHELHRVIRRPDVADEITIPLADLVDRATVMIDTVTDVDRDQRVVHLGDDTLAYDVCAVCLGAETAFYGLEDVREHAFPLKRIEHARAIRSRILEVVETRAREEPAAASAHLVVGGAGLSGVQVAGELAALLREDGADLDAPDVSVTLLEQADRVAPLFDTAFQDAVRDALEGQGVEVRTGAAVVGATESTVTVESVGVGGDGERRKTTLPADVFVWTGGIRGPAPLEHERPLVKRDLRLDQRAFVLGDAARVVDADGEAVPASAQAAVREARVVAENVSHLVEYLHDGGVFEPRMDGFAFDAPGWLVTVGDDTVAQVGPSVFRGQAALALKTTVGVGYLSSVGAVREAVELVQSELGGCHSRS